jgi:predicted dehydrogenase
MGAAKQVQAGVLGKITRIEFMNHFHQQRWARPAESVKPEDVDWTGFQMDGRIRKSFDARLLREWQLFPETTNGIPGLWMSHFIDLVPWYTGAKYPATAASNGGVFLWKDGRDTSDVFYTVLTYPEEFAVLFSMSLTNGAGMRNMWFGTKGTLDCDTWTLSGAGSSLKEKIAAPVKIQPEITNSHMANFLECIRSRGTPRADVEAGFAHAVAGIMSAEALKKGRTLRFNVSKLEIV